MKILHLLPTLKVGGAERFLERLAPVLIARHGVEQQVAALLADGPVGEALRARGIAAFPLSTGGTTGLMRATGRARTLIDAWQPDLVQTWLYMADVAGAIATAGRPQIRLVWNIRCSDIWLNRSTRLLRSGCVALSRFAPDAIIACGERPAEFHRSLGYPGDKMTVIPNGYRFAPLAEVRAGRVARGEAEPVQSVIGAAGRYDQAKGYGYLLAATALLRRRASDVRLALAGRGCDWDNPSLAAEIDRHGLRANVDLHGELDDMGPFYAGLDVFCLSSISEGFPNVLCEAMAAGIPAVATDVGDAPAIIAPTSPVPTRSVEALAARLAEVLAVPRSQRDAAAMREAVRIRAVYDLDVIADRYHAAYDALLHPEKNGGRAAEVARPLSPAPDFVR